jgi:sulfite reductase alpha subunit-like flavoprotein
MVNHINMEAEEIKDIISNFKNKPNKSLVMVMDYLKDDFEKTKELLIKLTHHLDSTEKEYNKIYDEYKKRMNE